MSTSINVKEKTYEIVNGPNKDTIFDACKYAYSLKTRIPLEFEVALGYTAPPSDSGAAYIPAKIKDLRISGIQHEDGSGESLNLLGYCQADLTPHRQTAVWSWYRFKAYYNTKRRTGHIVFLPR